MLRSAGRRFIWIAVLFCAPAALAQQPDSQLPDAPQPQAQAPPPQSQAPPPSDDQQQQGPAAEKKKPESRVKRTLKRGAPNCIKVFGAEKCKDTSDDEQADDSVPPDQQPRVPASQPLPRSANPNESSSKENEIPLGLPGSSGAPADVQEFHPYNPHKADKDVEVGDFYFKRDNYRAAESRYAEALEYMPNHAEATFKLAQSEEKLGKAAEARAHYEKYLKILPEGDFAKQAREALARLQPHAKETISPPAQKRR